MNSATQTEITEYTPDQVLADLARIVSEHPGNPEHITLADIRDALVDRMAETGKRFSKDYRHAATPIHEHIYGILCGTVLLNFRADDAAAQ